MQRVLTINVGSSSVKSAVFNLGPDDPELIVSAEAQGLGTSNLKLAVKAARSGCVDEITLPALSPALLPDILCRLVEAFDGYVTRDSLVGVAHRVVHGGVNFTQSVIITPLVIDQISALVPLAPLHQPQNISGINAMQDIFPGVQQVACFDTSFHRGRSALADMYAIPRKYFEAGVRRYGFHGLSVESVVRKLKAHNDGRLSAGRVIVAHLGSGASLCALRDGKSVATTMGFSTLDGLAMGTRCGQIDPGVLIYLAQELKLGMNEISDILYRRSGLLGLSGISADMRALAASDQPQAKEAIDYFVTQIVKSIGELAALLEGLDTLVFTGGIGTHSFAIRTAVMARLGWLGAVFESGSNATSAAGDIQIISAENSKITAIVVPTDEERMMAIHAAALLTKN